MNLKRLLTLSTLAFFYVLSSLAGNGGTSIQDAILLTEKEDSCLFKAGTTDQDAYYYVYTAAETGLLNISGNSSCGFTAVDASESEVPSMSSLGSCTVPLTQGTTVYIKVWPNMSVVETDFIAHFSTSFSKDSNAGKGASADNPIILKDNVASISVKGNSYIDNFNTYLTYTASANGVLSLSCTSYLNMKKYGASFGDLSHDFISEYNSGYYVGKIPVRKGETVCIMINTYQSVLITAEMTDAEQGTIYNPYVATVGDNKVPGYFGNYYYEYQGSDADGFLLINSLQSLPRGYVQVFTLNDIDVPVARSESGTYSLRFSVKKGTPYIIHVFKAEDSEEEDDDYEPLPDTMTLTFESLGEGDTANNPIRLDAATTVSTSANTGTYYYVFTVPADAEDKMLEFSLGNVTSGNTSIMLYDTQMGQYYAVYGTTAIKTVATAGRSYMLVLDKKDTGAYTITTTLRNINMGEAINKAITAVKGDNSMPADKDVYYMYEATLTGKMTVTFHIPGISIEFPKSTDSADGIYSHTSIGSSYLIDVEKGKTYYIHVSNVTEASLFSLSEHEYAEGEAKATAIELTGNCIVMPSGQADLWYKYIVEKDGKLTIASEDGFIGDEATIIYFCTDDNETPYYINTSNDDGDIIYYATQSVKSGQVVYIHIATGGNFGGKKVECSVRDYATGETIDNPYLLTNDRNEISGIPVASHSQHRWVKIPMAGYESVELKTNRYVSGGAIETKDAGTAYVATFIPDANNDVCTLTYMNDRNVDAIYVCFEISGGIVTLTGTFKAASGIDSVCADASNDGAAAYSVAGQKVDGRSRGIVISNGKKFVRK